MSKLNKKQVILNHKSKKINKQKRKKSSKGMLLEYKDENDNHLKTVTSTKKVKREFSKSYTKHNVVKNKTLKD